MNMIYEFNFLREACRDPNVLWRYIDSCGTGINSPISRGRTPLAYMVHHDLVSPGLLWFAIERGANILFHMGDNYSSTIAAELMKLKNNLIIEMVMKTLKDKRSPLDDEGNTMLHYAAFYGDFHNLFRAKCLVGNLESKNYAGDTALHLAVKRVKPGVVKALLRQGAEVETRDCLGNTPLISAAKLELFHRLFKGQIMQTLIDYKAKVNVVNNDGLTPFTTLCHSEEKNQVLYELLLNSGADLNYGRSTANPLHFICLKDSFDPTFFLVNGADIESKDPLGYTPLFLSVLHDNLCSTEILLTFGAKLENCLQALFRNVTPNVDLVKIFWSYMYLRISKDPKYNNEDLQQFKQYLIDNPDVYHQHYIDTINEVELMKDIRIGNTKYTMYDLAGSTVDGMMEMCRLKKFRSGLETLENLDLLKIFKSCIQRKACQALYYRSLYVKCVENLPSVIMKELPILCLENILKYLDPVSMRSLSITKVD